MQQSSFPPLSDDVDNDFGVPQHSPPKFVLSFWEGETPGVFLHLNIVLQNLGFLLKRERLLVFFVCRSIILHNLGVLLGKKGLPVFCVCHGIIHQNVSFLLGREGLLVLLVCHGVIGHGLMVGNIAY